MSLPNYLAKIKSSGIYRFVWDKSEIAGVPADILRLVVGYSDKGPFNTPVYVTRDTEFKAIFGDISKKLEKRGVYFHRMALQALSKGPIIVLNLKKFSTETVNACSFDVKDEVLTTRDIPVESIYDTSRFWKLDPEAILAATAKVDHNDKKYISIAAADSKESSCSIFVRGYKPNGYDVTVKNWFATLGEEVPDYFTDGDKDYSSLLVSDFFAEVYVFKGQFTAAICASDPLNKYFDIVGGKPQLKEYIVNGFGDKIDTLTALSSEDASNFVNVYSGCLLPFFKSQNGQYISLDLLFNADNAAHKMMMQLNSDLLYNGDVKVADITTTGWLADSIFGAPLKKTTQIYSATKFNKDEDGQRTYDFAYAPKEFHEATAHDYDLIEYRGSTGVEDTLVKYLGGYEYKLIGTANIDLYHDGSSVKVLKFDATGESYTGAASVFVFNGSVYSGNDGEGYVNITDTAGLSLEDLEVLTLSQADEMYDFVSYQDEQATTEWERGSLKIVSRDDEKTTVEVVSNEPYPEKVGSKYVVHATELDPAAVLELYTLEDEPTSVYVKISAHEGEVTTVDSKFRFEGVDGAYRAYHKVDGESEYTDIYLKSGAAGVYSDTVGTEIEDATYSVKNCADIDGFDFLSAGFVTGDRLIIDNDIYTITELTKDFAKASNAAGVEKILTRKDTVVKCNHSCSVTSYMLKPYYFEGYLYTHSAPINANGSVSTADWDKLQWHKFLLSTLVDYDGLRTGLTSRKDIDYRYIVDTFEGLVDEELHKELSLICKEKDNAVAFINFPTVKTFKNCEYSSFTDEKGRFQTKYIVEGANKKKNPSVLFSLASEQNGASFASYNTPLLFTDGTVKNYVPAAALVSNNFMDKYAGRQPYYVVAGPTYGRLVYTGLVGPDFNYTRADLDLLEPFGVNVTVYVPRLGTFINSNKTAKKNPVTALSALNVRELVIYLQDEIEALLQDYQWEFNTPYLRDLIKAKADTICEKVKNNGGIQEYLNVCDESNNTDDVIDNEMFVLSTSIEPGRAGGKMIQELTIYKSGALRALIK